MPIKLKYLVFETLQGDQDHFFAKEMAITEAATSAGEAVETQPVIEAQADDTAVAESPTKEPEEDKEKGSSDEG